MEPNADPSSLKSNKRERAWRHFVPGPAHPRHLHGRRSGQMEALQKAFNEAASNWRSIAFGVANKAFAPHLPLTHSHYANERKSTVPRWRRTLDDPRSIKQAVQEVNSSEKLTALQKSASKLALAGQALSRYIHATVGAGTKKNLRALRASADASQLLFDLGIQMLWCASVIHEIEREVEADRRAVQDARHERWARRGWI